MLGYKKKTQVGVFYINCRKRWIETVNLCRRRYKTLQSRLESDMKSTTLRKDVGKRRHIQYMCIIHYISCKASHWKHINYLQRLLMKSFQFHLIFKPPKGSQCKTLESRSIFNESCCISHVIADIFRFIDSMANFPVELCRRTQIRML